MHALGLPYPALMIFAVPLDFRSWYRPILTFTSLPIASRPFLNGQKLPEGSTVDRRSYLSIQYHLTYLTIDLAGRQANCNKWNGLRG